MCLIIWKPSITSRLPAAAFRCTIKFKKYREVTILKEFGPSTHPRKLWHIHSFPAYTICRSQTTSAFKGIVRDPKASLKVTQLPQSEQDISFNPASGHYEAIIGGEDSLENYREGYVLEIQSLKINKLE